MKSKTTLLIALVALTASAQAFVVSTTNLGGVGAGDSLPVTTFSGSIIGIGSGSISVGYFGTILDSSLKETAFSALKSDFFALGAALPFSNAFSAPGLFDVSVGAAIPDVSAFIGKSVYVFIGNEATIAGSTDLGVWKSNLVFAATSNSVGGPAVLTQNLSSLLVGSNGGPNSASGLPFDKSLRLANAPVVVPEPSAALLGAIGVLGLLRRRRN